MNNTVVLVLFVLFVLVVLALLYLSGFLFGRPKTYRKLMSIQKENPSESEYIAKYTELCSDSDFKSAMDELTQDDYLTDSLEGQLVVELQGKLKLRANPCEYV